MRHIDSRIPEVKKAFENQITDIEALEAEGLTIHGLGTEFLFLQFSSGKWCALEVKREYEEADLVVHWREAYYPYQLWQAGLLTKEVYDKQNAYTRRIVVENQKQRKRKRYEELKLEFEGKE